MQASNWLVTHIVLIGGCWVSGVILDAMVFELSHDYVFPPNSFQRNGLLTGWLGAATACTILQWSTLPRLPMSSGRLIVHAVFTVIVGLGITLTGPLIPVTCRELGLGNFPELLQTGRRHLYCMGIPTFAMAGWAASALFWYWLTARRRTNEA